MTSEAVLAYLSRCTHPVGIANRRLIAVDQQGVTFKWEDCPIAGRDRHNRMTLATDSPCRSEPILAGRGVFLFWKCVPPN
jgi:hypothetical protein